MSTAPADYADLLADIAREAAAVLASGYRAGNLGIEHKGTIDLVTRFDRAAEDCIRARVARDLPGITLVAEESAGTLPTDGRPTLWADPLDGTTNFAHGHPFFAVSLGLFIDHRPVAAAVDAPALATAWRAALGHGTLRNTTPTAVSATETLQKSLLATGFPYDNATNPVPNFREYAALTRRSRGVRRCGSAALDLCLTADGTYDAYWERHLKPWDMAAGVLLVTEAGGRVTSLADNPLDLLSGEVVASNGRVHAELLSALRAAASEPV